MLQRLQEYGPWQSCVTEPESPCSSETLCQHGRLTLQDHLPSIRMEISPNRIRGCMITFSNVWSGVGGIITSLMMQQLKEKHLDNCLIAMGVIWGPIGVMGLCWAIVPESPWFHARWDHEAAGVKALRLWWSSRIRHSRRVRNHNPNHRARESIAPFSTKIY